jgi:hypothetical protein
VPGMPQNDPGSFFPTDDKGKDKYKSAKDKAQKHKKSKGE